MYTTSYSNKAIYEAGPIAGFVLVILLIWGCSWKGGSKVKDPIAESSSEKPADESESKDRADSTKPYTDQKTATDSEPPTPDTPKVRKRRDDDNGGGGGSGRKNGQDWVEIPGQNGSIVRLPPVKGLKANVHFGNGESVSDGTSGFGRPPVGSGARQNRRETQDNTDDLDNNVRPPPLRQGVTSKPLGDKKSGVRFTDTLHPHEDVTAFPARLSLAEEYPGSARLVPERVVNPLRSTAGLPGFKLDGTPEETYNDNKEVSQMLIPRNYAHYI
jgi:hypothetical protein